MDSYTVPPPYVMFPFTMANREHDSSSWVSREDQRMAPWYPTFAAAVNGQGDSPFFSLLPAEIRQLIYAELWRSDDSGLSRQHITWKNNSWTRVPCITDPLAEDVRYANFMNADPGSDERSTWLHRLMTEWTIHWECEEAYLNRIAAPKSSYPGALLSCKRMYLECMPSICNHATVIFTNLIEAENYLTRYPPTLPESSSAQKGAQTPASFRSIEICVQATTHLTSLYAEKVVQEREGRLHPIYNDCVTMTDNPWARVCAHLAMYQNLNDLRIWFNSSSIDLKPWYERVDETSMFADLLKVRTKSKGRFVLELPEINTGRGWLGTSAHETRQDRFLQGRILEEAPFTIIRGPRQNMTRVHMVGLGSLSYQARQAFHARTFPSLAAPLIMAPLSPSSG
ncbi:hypothetical protein QBC34DRAFT_169734 [Podospora aff. communis PSN243]|uniref:DUF7730 domain-containing protein n=1 Tax=Podospora aff. communis PSN243 TaxID=3040156 RepID=A0AAV9GAI9_9PEZI|nr:hypothetical protein QBC34DRAFT_169734 [Podospora aff. communis PSN243]